MWFTRGERQKELAEKVVELLNKERAMHYPLSEIIDRLSILMLKHDRLPYDEKLNLEVVRFTDAAYSFLRDVSHVTLHKWLETQKTINGKIWDIEASLRQDVSDVGIGLEEIGRQAIAIRNLNRERIALKNKIARSMHEYEEVKVDHLSEAV